MKLRTINVLVFTALVLCSTFSVAVQSRVDTDSYIDVIVGFKTIPDLDLFRKSDCAIHEVYSIIPAVYVSMPQAFVEALKKNPNVDYIAGNDALSASGTVNWAADAVNASMAWSQSTGAGVKVAVLDTGAGPARDLTISGGYNFVGNNTYYADDNGHGTMVAGIIAAVANSTIGISGVAPSAEIYAVKILDKDGVGTVDRALGGIQWALDNGMNIISMSWSLNDVNRAVENALQAAYNSGILLVAAAGNTGDVSEAIWCPASFDSVIAVSGIRKDYTRLLESCYGPKIELTAPGEKVYSTWLNNQLGSGTGTSMAAPFVSGVAALVWARNPSLTNIQVRNILDGTAADLGDAGRDIYYGYGLVNASAAVYATPSDLAVGFSYSPTVVYSNVNVNFDASTSFGGVSGYTTYLWNFGDGGTTITNSPHITHIYNSTGYFTVNLTVNNTFGFSNSTDQTISVLRDSMAPITSDNYDGLAHTSTFTIVLNAQDNQSGVAETYYKVNGGSAQTVSVAGQPQISSSGANTLEYWSIDFAGNVENPHTIAGIKLEPPVGSIEPTQSPPPTIEPTDKPKDIDTTPTPSPTASSSLKPSQNSPTPGLTDQGVPFFMVCVIVVVAGLVVLSLVTVWFKRK